MNNHIKKALLLLLCLLFLTGCFYPAEQRGNNEVPYPEQLISVEQAVKKYQEDTRVLPILTKEEGTPLYEKYVLDFTRLVPRYMARPPGNSFSEGGPFLYVLVNVEDEPQVKLLDLRLTEEVRNLQLRLNDYLQRHTYLPIEEILANGYYTLDYDALKLKKTPLIQSPFSHHHLPFIVNKDGRVGIDYRLDVYQALQAEGYTFVEDADLRQLLVENTYFVPAHSFAIILQDGELIFK